MRTPRGRDEDDNYAASGEDECEASPPAHNAARSVRHEVETVLTFPLHDALNMGTLLDLLHRLQASGGIGSVGAPDSATRPGGAVVDAHTTTPSDERTASNGAEDDMIPPFSSIKRGSAGGKQLAALSAAHIASMGGHAAQAGGGDGDRDRMLRPLARSKRSLFDVRVSLDDSSDDDNEDEDFENISHNN